MTPTFVAQNYKWNIYKVIKTSIPVGRVLTAFLILEGSPYRDTLPLERDLLDRDPLEGTWNQAARQEVT